ncbi:hypothetical protein [Cohnella lupini]|uniref:Uncharacterized protein n=1 Tax=Cohnella lupini TaxID=1294267 RepID=A0A3D9IY85_9BACL|nr:hypothetical protein [Cohnella lupini]RED66056.1 hypothetical protein DFP95_101554 [Cohnella lupini]
MSPWLSIVLLGIAISGYAWMMPRTATKSNKETEFVSEEAYSQLLEDLETENRELFDAVAKFKSEQDETVGKLNRRIVDMEYQMKKWSEQSLQPTTPTEVKPPYTTAASFPTNEIYVPAAATSEYVQASAPLPVVEDRSRMMDGVAAEPAEIEIAPTTIRGRYPELLAMHDKGRSIEQIAKALGMNKGEVQLILQLVRREEQQNA